MPDDVALCISMPFLAMSSLACTERVACAMSPNLYSCRGASSLHGLSRRRSRVRVPSAPPIAHDPIGIETGLDPMLLGSTFSSRFRELRLHLFERDRGLLAPLFAQLPE